MKVMRWMEDFLLKELRELKALVVLVIEYNDTHSFLFWTFIQTT